MNSATKRSGGSARNGASSSYHPSNTADTTTRRRQPPPPVILEESEDEQDCFILKPNHPPHPGHYAVTVPKHLRKPLPKYYEEGKPDGETRIGDNYQAQLVSRLQDDDPPHPSQGDILWEPVQQAERMNASDAIAFAGILNGATLLRQTHLLHLLHQCQYNFTLFKQKLHDDQYTRPFTGPGSKLDLCLREILDERGISKRRRPDRSFQDIAELCNLPRDTVMVEYYKRLKDDEPALPAQRKRKRQTSSSDGTSDYCVVCDDGGSLILCDKCDKPYHLHCHNPPLQQIPEGQWFCSDCQTLSPALFNRARAAGKKLDTSPTPQPSPVNQRPAVSLDPKQFDFLRGIHKELNATPAVKPQTLNMNATTNSTGPYQYIMGIPMTNAAYQQPSTLPRAATNPAVVPSPWTQQRYADAKPSYSEPIQKWASQFGYPYQVYQNPQSFNGFGSGGFTGQHYNAQRYGEMYAQRPPPYTAATAKRQKGPYDKVSTSDGELAQSSALPVSGENCRQGQSQVSTPLEKSPKPPEINDTQRSSQLDETASKIIENAPEATSASSATQVEEPTTRTPTTEHAASTTKQRQVSVEASQAPSNADGEASRFSVDLVNVPEEGFLLVLIPINEVPYFHKYRRKRDGSKGPAEENNYLTPGDRIVAIEGTDVSGMTFNDVRTIFKNYLQSRVKSVRVTFERDQLSYLMHQGRIRGEEGRGRSQ